MELSCAILSKLKSESHAASVHFLQIPPTIKLKVVRVGIIPIKRFEVLLFLLVSFYRACCLHKQLVHYMPNPVFKVFLLLPGSPGPPLSCELIHVWKNKS